MRFTRRSWKKSGDELGESVFWVSLAVLFYTFLGYPAIIIVAGWLKKPNAIRKEYRPNVSILICAHNEEKHIARKIENAFQLDYPPDKLEVIVVSDGSTDRTDDIARSFDDPRLKLIAYPERGGKVKAINTAIDYIKCEVVILTDANSFFEVDAIKKLINVLADDTVGCTVGNVILKSADDVIIGEGLYSRYEKAIHSAESRFSTMITIDGAMYALRREFLRSLPIDTIADDWYLATSVLKSRKRIVYVPDAMGYEFASESVSDEFVRKVRIVAGGYQTAFRRAKLFFNPLAFPAVFIMFLSHKLLRWTAMIFMILLFISRP